jgi:alkylation response protein AidB-like acyl-CoA dehydrogenase
MSKTDVLPVRGGSFLVAMPNYEEVFTPEDFESIHKDIGKAVDDFVNGEIANRNEEIEVLDNKLSRELMQKAGHLGLLGIDIPEKFGGMGLDKVSSALVSEKFAYGAGSFYITELNHTGIGTLPLALFGTEAQLRKYLPGLSSGRLVGAFALTEPEAGSDALNPMTTAELSPDGNYYILNGNKQFITNAGFADVIFTYGKVDGNLFTAFIVEGNWEGVSIGEEEKKMGMHGTSTRAYHFDKVKVPVANVLGEIGKGHIVALNALNMGRFKVGAGCIGSAKRAFSEALKYAKKRVQFGEPICEFGLIKRKISRMAVMIFAAETMMYRTARLIDDQLIHIPKDSNDYGIKTAEVLEDFLIECSINKIYGSEAEAYVVDEEVQIFGGYGYINGNHPELAYRNARINRIWEGTNEINRIVILNTLIRRAVKGMIPMKEIFSMASDRIQSLEPVHLDYPDKLVPQAKLAEIARTVVTFVLGLAYERYGETLRNEQELIGMISDLIIEAYSIQSTLMRSQKILARQGLNRAILPIKLTKLVSYQSLEKIECLARAALGVIETGSTLTNHTKVIRELLLSPPLNIVTLERDIANAFIRYSRYVI